MKKTLIINGKFLLSKLEGMPRVGREITAEFDALIEAGECPDLEIIVAAPRGGAAAASYKNIKIVEVGLRSGLFWEQIEFPLYAGKNYTLNFTATAPIILKNGAVVVHDAQFKSTKQSHGWKSFVLYNVITPIVAKRYKTIISVSEYARREVREYKVCERDDIHVVLNGADHVLRIKLDGDALSKYGLESQTFYLSNSYVHTHKNVKVLLEAFSVLPDLQLVLFGSSVRADFEERGISVPENVKFLGRVTDGELVALMGAARTFLFPSLTEGFGLPPLEAMLRGCPTICSAAGAMPETCGDGALFADPNSPEAWRAAIERLNDDAVERARLSEAGKQRAAQFAWSRSARQYLDVIRAEMSA